jgi:hypothetical protein
MLSNPATRLISHGSGLLLLRNAKLSSLDPFPLSLSLRRTRLPTTNGSPPFAMDRSTKRVGCRPRPRGSRRMATLPWYTRVKCWTAGILTPERKTLARCRHVSEGRSRMRMEEISRAKAAYHRCMSSSRRYRLLQETCLTPGIDHLPDVRLPNRLEVPE